MAKIDLTGQRFNFLIVIGRGEANKRNTIWICRCDCGAECTATTNDLTRGHKKSCGCLKRQSDKHITDLIGKTFGRLTVIKFKGIKNHRAIWRCRCVCGRYTDVRSNDLLSGNTKSCGCWGKHRALYDGWEVKR